MLAVFIRHDHLRTRNHAGGGGRLRPFRASVDPTFQQIDLARATTARPSTACARSHLSTKRVSMSRLSLACPGTMAVSPESPAFERAFLCVEPQTTFLLLRPVTLDAMPFEQRTHLPRKIRPRHGGGGGAHGSQHHGQFQSADDPFACCHCLGHWNSRTGYREP
jgi:hypothetical protein